MSEKLKNDHNSFPELNSLKPKDVHFTVLYDKEKQKYLHVWQDETRDVWQRLKQLINDLKNAEQFVED